MIIDLTHVMTSALPVYPGDTKTLLLQTQFMEHDGYNNHQLITGMHAGTHIDGPMHLLENHRYLNEISIDTFVGEGCLIDAYDKKEITYIEEYEQKILDNQIVLLYTGHNQHYGQNEYFLDYPVITKEFAELLVRKKVKMIGMDTPSPDKYPFEIHKYLLSNNILIIENLTNLETLLELRTFEIIALPLNIKADSSIARVIANIR